MSKSQRRPQTTDKVAKPTLIEGDVRHLEGEICQTKNTDSNRAYTETRLGLFSYSGPLPPPKIIAEYEEIYPGAAKAIFTQFEKQGDHRRKMEDRHLLHMTYRSYAGLVCGAAVCLAVVGFGGYAVYKGQDLAAAAAFIGAMGGLAAVFITGKYFQKKDLSNKAQKQTPERELTKVDRS